MSGASIVKRERGGDRFEQAQERVRRARIPVTLALVELIEQHRRVGAGAQHDEVPQHARRGVAPIPLRAPQRHGRLHVIEGLSVHLRAQRLGEAMGEMIERIAQSFADACSERDFSNKLIIVIRPEEASKFSLHLFQVRDFLGQSLHA